MLRQLLLAAACVCAANAGAREWNVTDSGALGDGQRDCSAAFQQAMNEAAAAGGGIVNVPAGQYRIAGTLEIPGGVTLQGTFRVPPADQRENRPKLDGSVLLAYAGRGDVSAKPFITLAGSMATLAGFMITYPEWQQSDVPPVPYPPTVFAGAVVNTGVLDCNFLNSYEALHFERAARFLVRNVHGFPLFRGLYIDMCMDIGRVENVHFWPFGGFWKPEDPMCHWVNMNGVAFDFRRQDWCYVTNTFCFGYGIGYKFAKSPVAEAAPGTTNGQLLGIGADSCERAVYIEETQQGGLQITNAELVGRWGSKDAVCLEIAAKDASAVATLSNCTFWGPIDRCIWVKGKNARLNVHASTFCSWDVGTKGAAAIQVDGGKAIVQGNQFMQQGTDVRVAEAVRSAILMGNQASGGFSVENCAGARTQLSANEESPVVWTKQAKRHYRLYVGQEGDGPYLRHWNAGEGAPEWPSGGRKRWSTGASELVLPVQPHTRYTITLDVCTTPAGQAPEMGLYLGKKRIAEFPAPGAPARVSGTIPPQKGDKVTLTIRCKGFVPKDGNAASMDDRELGVMLRSVTMKAKRAPDAPIFPANAGD